MQREKKTDPFLSAIFFDAVKRKAGICRMWRIEFKDGVVVGRRSSSDLSRFGQLANKHGLTGCMRHTQQRTEREKNTETGR